LTTWLTGSTTGHGDTLLAEKTLTKDTVPVDVDAVLFWVVWDAEKAALEVADYKAASPGRPTALREIIGQSPLADILVGRDKMDAELQKIIDERTTPWVSPYSRWRSAM